MRWLSRVIAASVLVGAGMSSAVAAAIPGLGTSSKASGTSQVQQVHRGFGRRGFGRRGFGRRGFGRGGFGGIGLYVGPGWGSYYDDDYDYGPSYYYPSYRYRSYGRRHRRGRHRRRR